MDANILSADQPQSALDGLELLALDPDDISSQSSVETSIDEMTGKTLIGLGLSENIHFRDICEKILNEFGRDRFVHQLRISLKAFHENLREDAADEAQMATARLLKSRRGRLRISNQIVARLDNLHEEPDTRPSQGSIDRVETWLAGLQTSNHGHDPEDREGFETNVAVEYSDSEVDDDDLPQNVTQLKKAILGTRAFRLIMRDLTMLFLPKSLRHVLTSVPKTDIDLATSQDTGRINRSKLLFTKLTGITWNWWPLSPPRRVLTAGEARLSWKCVCGTWQWTEMPKHNHDVVARILQLPQDSTLPPYPCLVRSRARTPTTRLATVFGPGQTTTSAATRYTPASNGGLPTSTEGPTANANSGTDFALGTRSIKITDASRPRHLATMPSNTGYLSSAVYVLFGTKGPRKTFTPGQIRVGTSSTNIIFFRDLRVCFRRGRGFLRYWFSIWQIENCFVAKFNRLTYGRMVHNRKELPKDLVYKYNPRAGEEEAKNPPFSEHLFDTMYNACGSSCKWPSMLHDCSDDLPINFHLTHGTDLINQIPKRDSCFERDDTPEVWGLQAVLVPSVLRVVVYHVLWVLGPLVFWCWWLGQSPGDWQNASVPITVIVGGISAFWGSIAALGLGGENVSG